VRVVVVVAVVEVRVVVEAVGGGDG
jgi:hypothetical protein